MVRADGASGKHYLRVLGQGIPQEKLQGAHLVASVCR